MNVWIDFKIQSGAGHPDEELLKSSEFARHIESCIRAYPKVFGEIRPLDVWLSKDGETGELQISHEASDDWVAVKKLGVDLSMFQENPLSEKRKQYVVKFIDDYVASLNKK